MLIKIAAEAGKSIWKEVSEDVVKKGAAALVVEGVKATFDIWRRRKVRQDEYEFDQWKKAQNPDEDDEGEKPAKKTKKKSSKLKSSPPEELGKPLSDKPVDETDNAVDEEE